MDIRFGDHPSFHRAALGMVGGALLVGVALHPVTATAPIVGGIAGIAAGAAWGYGRLRWRAGAAVLATIAVLAAMTKTYVSAATLDGTPYPPITSWSSVGLAIAASVLALGLAAGGPRGIRGAAGVTLSAFVALVGMYCAMKIVGARETARFPGWTRDMAGAAAMGIVGALAMLPRHLRVARDPVLGAMKRLPANLDPEVRGLCDRAIAIWATAKEDLADEGGQKLVRDGVVKTLEVAVKSSEVRFTGANEAELALRIDELDKKIAATADAEAKAQYTAARGALEDQRRYRDHIAKGKERLVARMHNHVAALEKFRLAASSVEATRAIATTAVKQLEDLSQDVTASGDALAEVELEAPSTAVAANN